MPASVKRSITSFSPTPGHRAHEARGRRRRVRRADAQDFRDERRIAWDPVAHHDATARTRHAHHLLGDLERLRRKHGAEYAHDQIEALVLEFGEVAGVASTEPQVVQSLRFRSAVAGCDQILRDIDAEHVCAEASRRDRRRSVTATKVQDLEPFFDTKPADECVAAVAHRRCNPRKIALFPQCLIRIHRLSFFSLVACRWRRPPRKSRKVVRRLVTT